MAPLALELAQWGVSDPMSLAWLDPPPRAAFAQARVLLAELDAIDTQGCITEPGRRMAGFGLHPRLAHMLIEAERIGLSRRACETAALLSERDILRDSGSGRNVDIRARLEILHGFRRDARYGDHDASVDMALAHRILELAQSLEKRLAPIPHNSTGQRNCGGCGGEHLFDTGLVLALAYPDRIARRRAGGLGKYCSQAAACAWLPQTDALAGEEFLVVAELDGDLREAQIFLASRIDRDVIDENFAKHIVSEDFCGWDDANQAVVARRRRMLGQVVLSETILKNPDKAAMVQALLEGIRKNGLEILPWGKEARALRGRIAFLRRIASQPDTWPDVSDVVLMAKLEQWLMPYLVGITRLKELQSVDLVGALRNMLDWNRQKKLDELAPTHIRVPSGSRIPIDYVSGDEPILAVWLQELFGCTTTPTIAGGIAVELHLLSPANRPIQVTRDLANFWTTTYAEVRKDLRGRYPRHHWPDDPLEALPTNRAKPRKA